MFAMGPAFFRPATASYATLALTGTFAPATVGVAYSSSIPISGGLEPYSLTGGTGIVSGALDAGFSLSITGTTGARFLTLSCASPTTADTMTFTASVGSSDGQTATSAQSVAVSAGASPYNTVVAAAAPAHWWKLDETTGTSAADSVTTSPISLTRNGLAWTFADAGVSVAAPSGYLGLGRGIDLSVTGGAGTSAGLQAIPIPDGLLGASSATAAWAVVLWVAGSAKASQYIAARSNNGAAVIYQFVADQVEFFAVGYSGTDPRPGSQISLPSADTTTPHMIVYRYNNGQWSGFKDGVKVFDVARSFGCVYDSSHNRIYLGQDGGGNYATTRAFDSQLYNRAPTDAEIADMYAARNAA